MSSGPKPVGWSRKKPVSVPSSKRSTKVNLDLQSYDDLIENQGVRVRVYRTSYCPRVKSIDGAEHEIDCPLCHGAQFIDVYPISTKAFIQAQNAEAMPFVEGMYDGNSISVSFLSGIELQYFTLMELCDFTEVYIQRVKRQDSGVDVLKYKALKVNMLVDYNGKQYLEGSDFNIDVNGNLKWCPNKGPNRGTIYTINYETAVRFRAVRALHVNRFGNITQGTVDVMSKLPEQWLMQKDFLVERKDIDGNLIKPNKIRDSDED
jgi:hypothetical protein